MHLNIENKRMEYELIETKIFSSVTASSITMPLPKPQVYPRYDGSAGPHAGIRAFQ